MELLRTARVFRYSWGSDSRTSSCHAAVTRHSCASFALLWPWSLPKAPPAYPLGLRAVPMTVTATMFFEDDQRCCT
jgi:hypothetical protein